MSDCMVALHERYKEHASLFEAFGELLTEPLFILEANEQVIASGRRGCIA